MNAETALLETYQEWQHWAQSEGDAIQAGDWARVAHCQNALHQLQVRIPAAVQAAQAEWSQPGAGGQAREDKCRRVVAELIALETRNGQWLANQRDAMQGRLDDLDRSTSNLKRVQQTYSPGCAPAWTSFS